MFIAPYHVWLIVGEMVYQEVGEITIDDTTLDTVRVIVKVGEENAVMRFWERLHSRDAACIIDEVKYHLDESGGFDT